MCIYYIQQNIFSKSQFIHKYLQAPLITLYIDSLAENPQKIQSCCGYKVWTKMFFSVTTCFTHWRRLQKFTRIETNQVFIFFWQKHIHFIYTNTEILWKLISGVYCLHICKKCIHNICKVSNKYFYAELFQKEIKVAVQFYVSQVHWILLHFKIISCFILI